MLWIVLSVTLALGSVAVLAVLLLGLWRQVKALGSTVSKAEQALGGFSALPAPSSASRPTGTPATSGGASAARR